MGRPRLKLKGELGKLSVKLPAGLLKRMKVRQAQEGISAISELTAKAFEYYLRGK